MCGMPQGPVGLDYTGAWCLNRAGGHRDAKATATAEWHRVHEEALALKAKALRRSTLGQQMQELEQQNGALEAAVRSLAASTAPLEAQRQQLLKCAPFQPPSLLAVGPAALSLQDVLLSGNVTEHNLLKQ